MRLRDIPGLAERIASLRVIRTASFVSIPETIAGIEVLPMSLRHRDILELCGSPFVCGGPISISDIGAFLWIVSTEYRPPSFWGKIVRRKFLRRVARLRVPPPFGPLPADFDPGRHTVASICARIDDYLAETFTDAPAGGDGKIRPRAYCTTAALVDTFASEYGWTADYTRGLPIKALLQLLNRINERAGASVNDGTEDVVGRWLDRRNAELKAN